MPERPLRILFVDSAPFCGGAQESLRALLYDLHDRGLPLLLLSADQHPGGLLDGANKRQLAVRGLSARHWPASPLGLWQYVVDHQRCAAGIAAAVAVFRPTIIHANGMRAAMLLNRASCAGTGVVIHDRDLRAPALLPRLLARRLSPCIVAISQAVAEKWRELDIKQLQVIANGFDLPAIAAAAPAPRPFPPPAFVVVLAADFMPWKNHRLFLEAFASLRQRCPQARAVLRGRVRDQRGESILRALRQRCESLGLNDAVLFVTEPGPALPWIAMADLLIATASKEPFGRTLIEALALGKPVVASTGAGHTEILADCPAATLCPPEATALADAMAAWADPARRHRAAPAARQHAERYAIAAHSAAMLDFYQRLT